MGLYYSTDMILRWYKKADESPSQGHRQTQYTVIAADTLAELRDKCATADNVRKWLEQNHLPPDGYSSPYDGTTSYELLGNMAESLSHARAAMRAYIFLNEADAGKINRTRVYSAMNELRKLFLPSETRKQHTQRLLSTNPTMPQWIAENFKYVDECITMLLGLSPLHNNYLAVGYVLACIWADVVEMMSEDVAEIFTYASREYKSGVRKQQGDDVSVYIPWWENVKCQYLIESIIDTLKQKILKDLSYYRRKTLDGEYPSIKDYPGAWRLAISKHEFSHAGPLWHTADEMLSDILSNPYEYVRLALDDYVNEKMSSITYAYDSGSKKKQLFSPTLEAMVYAMMTDELSSGVQYRKCLLCDRYFKMSNHKTRRYCDIHRGSNAKYYRRKMEQEKKKNSEKTD